MRKSKKQQQEANNSHWQLLFVWVGWASAIFWQQVVSDWQILFSEY